MEKRYKYMDGYLSRDEQYQKSINCDIQHLVQIA